MEILDNIVFFLFILFMIFIFGGYHKNKSAQREKWFRLEEEKRKKEEELNKNS